MPADDIEELRGDWDRTRYAFLRVDAMSPVERQELADAVSRIDARFDRYEDEARAFRDAVFKDIATIREDINKIKGAARLAAWFVGSFTGLMGIAALVVMAVTRQQ